MTLIFFFRASSDELRKSENDILDVIEIRTSSTLITFLKELNHYLFEGKKMHTLYFFICTVKLKAF